MTHYTTDIDYIFAYNCNIVITMIHHICQPKYSQHLIYEFEFQRKNWEKKTWQQSKYTTTFVVLPFNLTLDYKDGICWLAGYKNR